MRIANSLLVLVLSSGLLLTSGVASAGRGGSDTLIRTAIESGSTDAIVAELERAEFLMCLSCVDTVLPLVDHPSARVRDAAGWWLGRRGVRDQVIADMTKRLSGGQDPTAARNAADVLAAMRDVQTLPTLAGYLGHPLDEDSGVSTARAIGAIGHPHGLRALGAGFASPLANVRAESVAAVRQLRAPTGQKVTSGVAPLLPLLADGDAGVRREAAYSVGHLAGYGGDSTGALAALTKLVSSDGSASVRKAAAWALGQLHDVAARPALTTAQNDSDPLVRSVATAALSGLR